MQYYRDDLAGIHDAGFTHYARNAAPLLVEKLRESNLNRGLVIDLGCGSGVLSEHMAAKGYDVLGIDQSPAFIAMAQRRVPNGRFRVGSIFKEELPNCVGVAAVGEIVNYLFDADNSRESLTRLLERIHAVLAPGGVLLFDASEPGRVPGPGPLQFNREGDGWAVLASSEEDTKTQILSRRIVSFCKSGELYRRDEEIHRLRLIPRSELADTLQECGFQFEFSDGYGAQRLPKGMVAVAARKLAGREGRVG